MPLLAAQSRPIQRGARARRQVNGAPRCVKCQRGNALIFVLLALIITGLGMAGYVTSKQIEIKIQAGQAEAMVLETLRNAANAAILENITDMQRGLDIVKTTPTAVTVLGTTLPSGQREWRPTVTQLRDMGYCSKIAAHSRRSSASVWPSLR